jgi:hypothetical protein
LAHGIPVFRCFYGLQTDQRRRQFVQKENIPGPSYIQYLATTLELKLLLLDAGVDRLQFLHDICSEPHEI